jgi:hypothetical protein
LRQQLRQHFTHIALNGNVRLLDFTQLGRSISTWMIFAFGQNCSVLPIARSSKRAQEPL